MEKMEYRGLVVRIRKCAHDLVSLEEDLVDDDDDDCDDEWWELMERELRLKSTFLYCDLNKVISSADDEHKKAFTSLANRLFYYMEELDNAVKSRSIAVTHGCYSDAVLALQDVVAALIPP